jgi:hypothetical protein
LLSAPALRCNGVRMDFMLSPTKCEHEFFISRSGNSRYE